jgi:putative ABC transport system permease protein
VLSYYFDLGLRSLRRNPVLTCLLITAIAVGIGASMTTLTVFRAMSGDPIPRKSAQLFVPQIDSRGPNDNGERTEDHLADRLTYIDAMGLMKARAAKRQTALFGSSISLKPGDPKQKPFRAHVRAVYTDFFPMFEVPLKYGSFWPASDDDNHAFVVVITRALNDRVFGGLNSVGKTLELGEEAYTIMGVLDTWAPVPQFYDIGRTPFAGSDEVFMPFTRAIDKQLTASGSMSCNTDEPVNFAARLASDCTWGRFWVELPTAADVAKYRNFLESYSEEQRLNGRFNWPSRTRLRDVMTWLKYNHVVPGEVRILILVSFGFLLVCLLNAMGLMLAKLLGRAGDIGVRRALGASRRAIFAQCLVETGVVGLAGGFFGLLLTLAGLWATRSLLPSDFVAVTHLDVGDVIIALLLGMASTVIAGLYPTWRASHVQPAWTLKTQ